jgi:hypothetical protein
VMYYIDYFDGLTAVRCVFVCVCVSMRVFVCMCVVRSKEESEVDA